jgi:hypothetical protein
MAGFSFVLVVELLNARIGFAEGVARDGEGLEGRVEVLGLPKI